MKIGLPLCDFNNCRHCFDGNCTDKTQYEKCEYISLLKYYIDDAPTAFEGMTNGEVLKILFPTFKAGEINSDTVVLEQFYPLPDCIMQFDRKWWEAPYKESEER